MNIKNSTLCAMVVMTGISLQASEPQPITFNQPARSYHNPFKEPLYKSEYFLGSFAVSMIPGLLGMASMLDGDDMPSMLAAFTLGHVICIPTYAAGSVFWDFAMAMVERRAADNQARKYGYLAGAGTGLLVLIATHLARQKLGHS